MPQKKAKTAAPFIEISPSNWTITTKLLGAGSYGCCYFASYRGMDVVSKNLVVSEVGKETRGQAENSVREELVYEACIMKKFGDHPGVLYSTAFAASLHLLVSFFLRLSLCSSTGTRENTNHSQYTAHSLIKLSPAE